MGEGRSSGGKPLQVAAPSSSQGPCELGALVTVLWARRRQHRDEWPVQGQRRREVCLRCHGPGLCPPGQSWGDLPGKSWEGGPSAPPWVSVSKSVKWGLSEEWAGF